MKLPLRQLAMFLGSRARGGAAALLTLSVMLASAPAFAQAPAEAAPPPPVAQPAPPYAQPAPPYAQPAPPYAGQPAAPAQYPQQYAQPAPAYNQPGYPYPPPPPARPSKGMMITGISIFGGSYLFSAIVGASLIDEPEYSCSDCQDFAPYLFIPVLGPFLAIPHSDGGGGVLALLGVVETVGAGLMIGGIIRFKRTKERAEQRGYYTFQLPEGRSLALDISASPLRLGPQLNLKF